ncbi:TonB-dependent receptor domain-containing protein [Antarcticibacterium sp. 1MA-6-2]|uniref:TonB-dependent receptor n=1 Tax=Antarcticibacterium sp. 1MA-6-2 TaxID=2908210 RepID=UPI002882E474|nr:TonB-dependent receptor [Antarcticibacterium sp. 1MA-6-2]
MRLLLILLLLLYSLPGLGQEVIVLEKNTDIPLPYVAIYNKAKTKSTVTSGQGKADLTRFSQHEEIIFKHISHLEYTTTKAQVMAAGGKIFLILDDNHLQEVVLSVSRFRQKKSEVPQKLVTIQPEEIAFANPQTSADLLESTGKVYVQKSQLGGGSPMIRGFATNLLLITVDGVRMNNAIFRSGNLQNVISIDPLAIEQAEVILGPGSVIYGSDAVGGVMNFYTLKPVFSYREDNFSGNAFSRYATANNEKTVHADFNVGFEKWAFLSSVSYSDFDDLRMGSHGPLEYMRPHYVVTRNGEDLVVENDDPLVQKPTGYNQINLLQKIAYQPHDLWDLNLGLYYSTTSNYPRYDRLYQERNGQLRSAEWYYGPQTWFLGHLQVENRGYNKFYDRSKLTAAYQFFEESRNDRNFGGEMFYNTLENVDAYSLNLDFEKGFGKNRFYYGAEYVFNYVGSKGAAKNIFSGEQEPSASRYPDGSTWQSLAAYSSFRWEVNQKLNIQFGARYNHVLLKAEFDEAIYDFPFNDANLSTGALTGSAGINWHPNKRTTWRANLATAFRAPNIDDVGKIFDSEPGSVVVPNPNLRPEYAYNGELGLNWRIGEFLVMDLASFYTILENAMVRRDFDLNGVTTVDYQGEESNVQAIQNAAGAYVYGFEAGAEIIFSEELKLISQLTATTGEEELDDGTTAPLRHAAPLFGNTHFIWDSGKLKLDLFSEYNGQFDYEDLAPSEQGKAYLYAIDDDGNPYSPSWYTINFT